MTQGEAKTKTCCASFSQVATWGTPAGAISASVEPRNCIGSACMAWRWVPKSGTSEDGAPNYYAGNWRGYCGLAGKP